MLPLLPRLPRIPFLFYLVAALCLGSAAFFHRSPPPLRELILIRDVSKSVTLTPTPLPEYVQAFVKTADQVHGILVAGRARFVEAEVALSPFPPVEESLEPNATDYASSLKLVEGLPRKGPTRRRLLLLGDGRQTSGENLHAASSLAPSTRLDVVGLGSIPSPDARVMEVTAPSFVFAETSFSITALLESDRPLEGEVVLRDGRGGILDRRLVRLSPSGEVLRFETRLSQPGLQQLSVSINVPGDRVPENDLQEIGVLVGGKRILWFGEPPPAGLWRGGVEVECPPLDSFFTGLPRGALVVLDNLPAKELPPGAVRLLEKHLREGLTLLVIGGEKNLGNGGDERGWHGDMPLGSLLPVRVLPQDTLALAIALDVSGSMGEKVEHSTALETKISLAGQAVLDVVEGLVEGDRVGVVVFRTAARDLYPLTEVEEGHTWNRLRANLLSLRAGGGTSIFAGIHRAFDMLREVRAVHRQVLLVSDGDTMEEGEAYTEALAQIQRRLDKEPLHLTVISVGARPDVALLTDLRRLGIEVQDAASEILRLSTILGEAVRRDCMEANGRVGEVFPHEMVSGWVAASLPPLSRYVKVGPLRKNRKGVALLTDLKGRPLLAIGQVGLGRVMVLAGAPWRDWGWENSQIRPLMESLVQGTLGRTMDFSLETRIRRGRLHVAMTPSSSTRSGRFSVNIEDLAGVSLPPFPLHPTAAGLWEGETEAPSEGIYRLDLIESHHILQIVPLFVEKREEVLRLGIDGAALERLAQAGGGRVIRKLEDFAPWEEIPVAGEGETPKSIPFLIFLGIGSLLLGLGMHARRG